MSSNSGAHSSSADYVQSGRNFQLVVSLLLALGSLSAPADGTACLLTPSQQVLGGVGHHRLWASLLYYIYYRYCLYMYIFL